MPHDAATPRLPRPVRLLGVLALFAAIVLPATSWPFPGRSMLLEAMKTVSLSQQWAMYAPNPSRTHATMHLVAHMDDGTQVELEETTRGRNAASTPQFFWNKTRVDIWRAHANFSPKKRNDNRTWYLRHVCIREARRGDIPRKIVMHRVTRRLTPPEKVRAGEPALGEPNASLVTVQYCKSQRVLPMIEANRARREGEP